MESEPAFHVGVERNFVFLEYALVKRRVICDRRARHDEIFVSSAVFNDFVSYAFSDRRGFRRSVGKLKNMHLIAI